MSPALATSRLPETTSTAIFIKMIAQSEIRTLPLSEKLELLEAVWSELLTDDQSIEVPQWHKDILDERQRSLEQGLSKAIDWELAKEQIKREVR